MDACYLTNEGFTNHLRSMGDSAASQASLLYLNLSENRISGTEGGRQLTLFPNLKRLLLCRNYQFGPLGAATLAPGLAAAAHLKIFNASNCELGNVGRGESLCARTGDELTHSFGYRS
jgi:hypothetical protein